jgi:hypothetical protein
MATATKTRKIRPDRFSATLQSSQNMSEVYPNLIKHKLMCLYKRHCRRGNSESEWVHRNGQSLTSCYPERGR